MPDRIERPISSPTFGTLARENSFRNPPRAGFISPILSELVAPHIESFNALFDDSGLSTGDGDGDGLLSLAIKDIGERVLFDRRSTEAEQGWGDRVISE
jgi:DNA-directed RNA polymerase I subunit RPA2